MEVELMEKCSLSERKNLARDVVHILKLKVDKELMKKRIKIKKEIIKEINTKDISITVDEKWGRIDIEYKGIELEEFIKTETHKRSLKYTLKAEELKEQLEVEYAKWLEDLIAGKVKSFKPKIAIKL